MESGESFHPICSPAPNFTVPIALPGGRNCFLPEFSLVCNPANANLLDPTGGIKRYLLNRMRHQDFEHRINCVKASVYQKRKR
jgi:hypothetical protein